MVRAAAIAPWLIISYLRALHVGDRDAQRQRLDTPEVISENQATRSSCGYFLNALSIRCGSSSSIRIT
jgi:hypothetical protein